MGDRDFRTVIVVTASTELQARAVESELAARQQAGRFPPNVLCFAIPDPSNARVGSGGATFNALLTCQELLATTPGWTLETSRVFMIHSGGDSQRLPCQSVTGKAWSTLPTCNRQNELDAPVDLLLQSLFDLFVDVPSGLVVASSDVLLLIPPGFRPTWPSVGATGLAIPTEKALGPNHGVYQVGPTGGAVRVVDKFWQKATVPELAAAGAVRPDDTVLIDTGVIYFSAPATLKLAELAQTYPLDCCSYMGLDMNRRALRIELYSDVMLAMGGGLGLTAAAFMATPSSEAAADRLAAARTILWRELADVAFHAAVVEGGRFAHVGTTSEYLDLLTAASEFRALYRLVPEAVWFEAGRRVTSSSGCEGEAGAPAGAEADAEAARTFTVLNSLFHSAGRKGRGSVVEHSELWGSWHVGRGSLLSAVRTVPGVMLRDGVAVQELRIRSGRQRVLSVLGVNDPIKDAHTKKGAVICGVPWEALMARAGVSAADLWPGTSAADASARTIWTAKLFPVFDVPPGAPGGLPQDAAAATPTLADRASLWMQWLISEQPGGEASFSGLAPGELAVFAGAHLAPEVIALWRDTPRLSLRDILAQADATIEFGWRRALRGKIDMRLLLETASTPGNVCVTDLVRRLGRGFRLEDQLDSAAAGDHACPASSAAFAQQTLAGLDGIAATAPSEIAGRALAVQSALLWAMAGWGSEEYKSGPAHNAAWLPAFALLLGEQAGSGAAAPPAAATAAAKPRAAEEAANRAKAVSMLASVRDQWMQRSHQLGRAARHYERAAQLLTSQSVFTAPVAAPEALADVPFGRWVTATAPARVDLAGGWSDTPPITFEAAPLVPPPSGGAPAAGSSPLEAVAARGGGFVVNVALQVDGHQPLGARARRVAVSGSDAPRIVIRTRSDYSADGQHATAAAAAAAGGADAAPGEVVFESTLQTLPELADYNQPHADGAIVKCALLCLGVVALPRDVHQRGTAAAPSAAAASGDLAAQLLGAIGGSLEVETWSLLPQGSGMGGSSILAATVVAAIARVVRRRYDLQSLVHIVLMLEQMLTSGGGWQDQLGGLYPGVKAGFCPPELPLTVGVAPVADPGAVLGAHLFIVYTGKTRLARNLLQRVLRQWAERANDVTGVVAALRSNAIAMTDAIARQDAAAIGACLDTYWSQKKRMAAHAEPAEVTSMLAVLRPLVHGASLCGAGGGGFLVGVAKERNATASIDEALRSSPATRGLAFSVHACAVDNVGLTLRD